MRGAARLIVVVVMWWRGGGEGVERGWRWGGEGVEVGWRGGGFGYHRFGPPPPLHTPSVLTTSLHLYAPTAHMAPAHLSLVHTPSVSPVSVHTPSLRRFYFRRWRLHVLEHRVEKRATEQIKAMRRLRYFNNWRDQSDRYLLLDLEGLVGVLRPRIMFPKD